MSSAPGPVGARVRSARRQDGLVARRGGPAFVVAVLPANRAVDFELAADVLGGGQVELATERDVAQHCPDCETGVLSPFGRQYGMKTMVDESLLEDEEIIFEGNTHHEAIRMNSRTIATSKNRSSAVSRRRADRPVCVVWRLDLWRSPAMLQKLGGSKPVCCQAELRAQTRFIAWFRLETRHETFCSLCILFLIAIAVVGCTKSPTTQPRHRRPQTVVGKNPWQPIRPRAS